MKVIVDYDVCASTGTCVQVCPEVFEIRGRRIPVPLHGGSPARVARQGEGSRGALPDGCDHARRRRRQAPALRRERRGVSRAAGSVVDRQPLDAVRRARPRSGVVSRPLDRGHDAVFRFCKEIVDATADLVCAFKPQIAYFAAQRAKSRRSRRCAATSASTYPDVPLILDAKRGDIGSTAEHYAREVFGRYGADAVTVNPYLGLRRGRAVPRAWRRA